jgi:hypothetical protein
MKASSVICAFTLLLAGFTPAANAVIENPADWDFLLETFREPGGWSSGSWMSDTSVPTGFPQYEYTWQLTSAQYGIRTDGTVAWFEFDNVDYGIHGPFVENGLAFFLDPILIQQQDPPPDASATILLGVITTGDGVGHITATCLEPEVTAVRVQGYFTVAAIPEPATVFLLSLGTLVLLRKR